ncbi:MULTISPECIES: hypothetical protein [Xanthomonas]|uniref:hypothetical protein n=1 Tax=Xanthomonas TaxID=338 RepID=UPI001237B2A4|nr:hypothetical protein [Xanthomonas phaseoli]MBO9770002.1 hypothetical protein [Xanthomonas phaseoli pv. dieffenbachiae]MBO9778159.1 hypothetical protein [Xanthomonas phaseoli pv. dieffenbachiae]MBO9782174.1 hypothetical protein [Xanthomonas phaseoli pv. dieffenbachiae]MBO9798307.1 hypothetical protein [Xanthomonas phaseoli pv. dieffenbachiae]MBO9801340.1 hypothetical protein [Xanthomonas phaseoli pv. dieffenbachiae]
MHDPIRDFIDRYKQVRAEHLNSQYLFKRKKGNSKLSELDFIAQDEEFYRAYLLDAQGVAKLRNATITPARWTSLILAVKNRSEMINAKIDFLNYMHTFLAICVPLFILAGQFLDKANWGAAAICVFFIVWLFKLRSELRVELSTAKELSNVFEQLSKGAV